jgi:hypothetical protein
MSHCTGTTREFIPGESFDFYKPMLAYHGKSIPIDLLTTYFYNVLEFTVQDPSGMHWDTNAYYDPKLKALYKSMQPDLPDKEEVVDLIIRSKVDMQNKALDSPNIIMSYFEQFMAKSVAKYGPVYDFDELIDALTAPLPYRFHNKFAHGGSKEQYGIWSLWGSTGFDAATHYLTTYQDLGSLHVGISCKEHGRFDVTANKHLADGICPVCKKLFLHISSGEYTVKETLSSIGVSFEREYYLKRLGATGNSARLRFDFYIPSLNIAIEYDGQQHYNPVEIWGGQDMLEVNKKRDNLKNIFCRENNIHLLRIPYTSLTVSKDVLDFIKECSV